MKQAIHIFGKDVRRLWPFILLILALDAVFTLVTPNVFDTNLSHDGPYHLLRGLLPFCWACLTAALVHDESLTGDREFWLTRPYVRRSLLAAKLLFMACFISLPLLLTHVAILVSRGLPLSNHLLDIAWAQVLVWMQCLFLFAAAAAITRGFQQFLLLGIFVIIAFMFAVNTVANVFGAPFWMLFWTLSAITLVTGTAVTLLLYLRRNSWKAGTVIFVCGVLGLLAAPAMFVVPRPAWAFNIQRGLSNSHPDSALIQIKPDLKDGVRAIHKGYYPEWRTISIPVKISKPPETEIESAGLVIRVGPPDGKASTTVEPNRSMLAYEPKLDLYHINFAVKQGVLEQLKKSAMIQVDAYLTVFGNKTTSRTSVESKEIRLPTGDGRCRALDSAGPNTPLLAHCLFAFQAPPRLMIHLEQKASAWSPEPKRIGSAEVPPILHLSSVSPIGTGSVQTFSFDFRANSNEKLGEYEFVVDNWERQGIVHQNLTISPIRLVDFEVHY